MDNSLPSLLVLVDSLGPLGAFFLVTAAIEAIQSQIGFLTNVSHLGVQCFVRVKTKCTLQVSFYVSSNWVPFAGAGSSLRSLLIGHY